MSTVPFTAFCPECQAGRTFTVLGFEPVLVDSPPIYDRPRVGCCVCGTLERDALVALSSRVTDDRESLGEISARLNTLDGEVEELREELHSFVGTVRNAKCNHCPALATRVVNGLYVCEAHGYSLRAL